MYKAIYYILFVITIYGCNQPKSVSVRNNNDDELLTDTVIEGNHIKMTLGPAANNTKVWLHLVHDNLLDSVQLNDWFDGDYKDGLLFMNRDKKITRTWMAKTSDFYVFVLPYHPVMGLYAYKVKNKKIIFLFTVDKLPIYSDYAFYTRYDSYLVITCNNPSARHIYGGHVWKLSDNERQFERMQDISHDIFLVMDSLNFINSANKFFEKSYRKVYE